MPLLFFPVTYSLKDKYCHPQLRYFDLIFLNVLMFTFNFQKHNIYSKIILKVFLYQLFCAGKADHIGNHHHKDSKNKR